MNLDKLKLSVVALFYSSIAVLVLVSMIELKGVNGGPFGRYLHTASHDFDRVVTAEIIEINMVYVSSRTNTINYSITYEWENEGEVCQSSFLDANVAVLTAGEASSLNVGDKLNIYTTSAGCNGILRRVQPDSMFYAYIGLIALTFGATFSLTILYKVMVN
ncbi:hypothetical protein [Marinobacter sp. F3R08]|uniref:hypothetical protein n=1 Tax=Marinobacter sp. F3R08 TaxID=2841559 RepID=UPI001C0A4757|nr:hypothetical protein [Marinobacter sp. F3R08]MBU2952717.1 hypothetical protein [Marinobacter sp. F3R08]